LESSLHNIISIITPVFNGRRHIEDCLRNVIDQRCDGVEHLVVDGGSSDGTIEVIREYAQSHAHIRWVSEPDHGQSDAMNKGIAMARGAVVGFLNVDDYYEPATLGRALEYFSRLPEPALLVGNCRVWDDTGRLLFVNRPQRLKFRQLLLGFDACPWPVNPAAYFYHKSLHQQIGPYAIDEHFALDLDFLLRAVRAAHVVYVDEDFGNYQLLPGTKTFTDIESGLSIERSRRLLAAYRRDLPWFWRLLFPAYHQLCGGGRRLRWIAHHVRKRLSR